MSKTFSLIRFIFKSILWLLLILLIGLGIAYFYLGSIVKSSITTFVPPITGTTATVESVDLSLLSGHVEINGLKIGNPKGYSNNNIFELGKVEITFQPKSVLSDKIVINSILISGTKISAELKNLYSKDNNITSIQNNINRYVGSSSTKTKAKQTTKQETKSSSKSLVIQDLKINDTTLSVGAHGQTASIVLPPIHKTGIGEKKSTSIPEIIADILNLISVESVKGITAAVKDLGKQGLAGATKLLGNGANTLTDSANSALSGLGGLLK